MKEILDKCFMFNALDDNEKNVVIDAMEMKQYRYPIPHRLHSPFLAKANK